MAATRAAGGLADKARSSRADRALLRRRKLVVRYAATVDIAAINEWP